MNYFSALMDYESNSDVNSDFNSSPNLSQDNEQINSISQISSINSGSSISSDEDDGYEPYHHDPTRAATGWQGILNGITGITGSTGSQGKTGTITRDLTTIASKTNAHRHFKFCNESDNNDLICSICTDQVFFEDNIQVHNVMDDGWQQMCGKLFCLECVQKLLQDNFHANCPTCRVRLTSNKSNVSPICIFTKHNLENLIVSCNFCDETMKAKDIQKHVTRTCEKSHAKACIATNCNFEGNTEALQKHTELCLHIKLESNEKEHDEIVKLIAQEKLHN